MGTGYARRGGVSIGGIGRISAGWEWIVVIWEGSVLIPPGCLTPTRRALPATAGRLTDNGVERLPARMMDLSVAYRQERPNVEAADLTALVIRALGLVLGKMIRDEGTGCTGGTGGTRHTAQFFLTTELVTIASQSLIEAYEIEINIDQVNVVRVGKTLTKMRFVGKRGAKGGKRGWLVSLNDLIRWAESYGLKPDEITGLDLTSHGSSGTSGTPGTPPSVFEGVL